MAGDVIRARQFEVVDDAGKVVGGIGINPDCGEPEMWLSHAGNPAVVIYTRHDGHGDVILDEGPGDGYGSVVAFLETLLERVNRLETAARAAGFALAAEVEQ